MNLSPDEFIPYIETRIEHEEEQKKMENERIGLICATLQNGIPAVMVKKTGNSHKPSDYFKTADAARQERVPDKRGASQRIYDCMMSWCGAAGSKK